jgi:hypothetical protein
MRSFFAEDTIPARSLLQPWFLLILTLVCFLCIPSPASSSSLEDVVYEETIKLLAAIPGMESKDVEKSKQAIRTLSYTQLRVLRAFSRLSDITGPEAMSIIEELRDTELRFETVLLLDYFSSLPLATVPLSRNLVELVTDVSFAASRALSSLVHLTGIDAPPLLSLIAKVIQLEPPGAWAAKVLLELVDFPFAAVRDGVEMIAAMSPENQWVAEQFCQTGDMAPETLLRGFRVITGLSSSNSWNARALLREDPGLSSPAALVWLEDFFRLDVDEQERRFADFTIIKKRLLLKGYAGASAELAREINNLHSVTDAFGREIGVGRLQNYSFNELEELFLRLHPRAMTTWSERIYTAMHQEQKNHVVELLYQATEEARRETAIDLTGGNIYLLLAHGDILYTSSFKKILVPLLRNRFVSSFNSDIISLIRYFDPDNNYSSRFISSLAWKGSLTEFLPASSIQQQQLIDLIAESAFTGEQALLMFATTFTGLLHSLHPEARSHLVDLMLQHIDRDMEIFSLQLQTILQYYLQRQTGLLSERDKEAITAMQTRKGSVDFSPFLKTPFQEWTRDKKLSSLSVFQQDDDGRASFLSNCTALLKNGYHPELAENHDSEPLPDEDFAALQGLFQNMYRAPEFTVAELFRFLAKHPILVHWKKTVNSIHIIHTVTLYRTKERQQELLLFFFNSGYEMFAQRGHSYWRRHQLFSPLEALLATGRIDVHQLQAKNMFLSLGSCGGIHAYLELGRIFGNRVDILATVGMGSSRINNRYNRMLMEVIAANPTLQSWTEVARQMDTIFQTAEDKDYLQPGSLASILHKTLYRRGQHHGTDKKI